MTQSKKNPIGEDRELAALAAATLGDGPAPSSVMIVPWGHVQSTNGSFHVDDESARLVDATFASHGCDLPIDYEHQSLGGAYSSPSGQAPAAGWIKSIKTAPDEGIVAQVEWTEQAREQLIAREYRYLSPVAIIRKNDRKLVALHSVALTNKPAIVGMVPIVNREKSDEQQIPANTTEQSEEALPAKDSSDNSKLLVTAADRVIQLEHQLRMRDVDDLVTKAMGEGKLAPAQRAWAVRLCLRDETLFLEWLRSASVVVQPGQLAAPHSTQDASMAGITARARAEFRSHPELATITSEDAYIRDAERADERRRAVGTGARSAIS